MQGNAEAPSERGLSFSRALTFVVYDKIGAGDAFASGILHGELSGLEPGRTVEFAAATDERRR